MIETGVFVLEGGDHRENRLAFLIRLNSSGGKRSTVVDSVYREGDFLFDISGAQEIAVKGMDNPVLGDGVHRPEGSLCHHLTPENASVRLPLAGCREDVFTGSS